MPFPLSPGHKPAWFAYALTGLVLWAIFRGLALHPEPYALGQYLYGYEQGFLIRGLIGTLARFAVGDAPMAMYGFVWYWSLMVLLFTAIWTLNLGKLRNHVPDNRRPLFDLLLLVLFSGPLLVTFSATRGFHDALVLGLGVIAWQLISVTSRPSIKTGSYAIGLMLLALLIHELVWFYLFPVLVFFWWLNCTGSTRTGATVRCSQIHCLLAATMLVFAAVLVFGQASEQQLILLQERINSALTTPYFDAWLQPQLTLLAVQDSIINKFSLAHLTRLIQLGHLAMLVPSLLFAAISLWLLSGKDSMTRRYSRLVFGLCWLFPHLLYLFAYDLQRFIPYSNLTSFLLMFEVIRRSSAAQIQHLIRPGFTKALWILIGMQTLVINYPPVWMNARNSTPLLETVRSLIGPDAVPISRVGTPHP